MDDLLGLTNEVWEQVATRKLPFVVAAFMTNFFMAEHEDIESRLKAICDSSNPDILRARFMQMQGTHTNESDYEFTNQIEILCSTWRLLTRSKEGRRIGQASSPRNTTEITVRRGPDSGPMDQECHTTMLENITRYMRSQHQQTGIVLCASPLYADIEHFLTHEDDHVNGLRCSYGLQMLLESYKSWLLSSQCTVAPSNCRLYALKFAQEVAASIDEVLKDESMPCRCYQTLAFHLESLQVDLQAFMQERMFDLYFQSPWVSGSHTLEMLESSFYYGLRLFSYQQQVGSVLHVYNILRNVIGFQQIPLLERLLDIFDGILFPGGRPDRNFNACCMRYMGGRLRFGGHASDHKSGCHKFEIPKSAAKATADFHLRKEANDSRFQYRKISLLHHIKEQDYHIDSCTWNRIHQLTEKDDQCSRKKTSSTSCHHHHSPQHVPFSGSPHDHISQLQAAVLTEIAGPFPVAKINFFKIYMSCAQIVSLISDKGHDQGSRCMCFVEIMVTAADRFKENEHKLQAFGCRELVKSCEEAITTVLKDKSLDDFLWKEL